MRNRVLLLQIFCTFFIHVPNSGLLAQWQSSFRNTTLHPNHLFKICNFTQMCGILPKSVVFEPNTRDLSKSVVFDSPREISNLTVVFEPNSNLRFKIQNPNNQSISIGIITSTSISIILITVSCPHLEPRINSDQLNRANLKFPLKSVSSVGF